MPNQILDDNTIQAKRVLAREKLKNKIFLTIVLVVGLFVWNRYFEYIVMTLALNDAPELIYLPLVGIAMVQIYFFVVYNIQQYVFAIKIEISPDDIGAMLIYPALLPKGYLGTDTSLIDIMARILLYTSGLFFGMIINIMLVEVISMVIDEMRIIDWVTYLYIPILFMVTLWSYWEYSVKSATLEKYENL